MKLKKIFILFLFSILFSPLHSFSEDLNELAYRNRIFLKAGTILNPDGVGDCLIFPYFDIRKVGEIGQFNEIIVENKGEYGIVARLRLRDGFRGRELFSQDIWIPSSGRWSARLEIDETGLNGKIYSNDTVVWRNNSKYFYLTDLLASGSSFTKKNIKKDRPDSLLYGYIEVIGSEKTSPLNLDGRVERLSSNERDCPNVLKGKLTINRSNGSSTYYDAISIGNFSRGQGSLFRSIKNSHPDLSDCEDTLDQLEFQLSKWEIRAPFMNDPSNEEKTSLIITFPTRQFHYSKKSIRNNKINNPFTSPHETNGGENFHVSLFFEGDSLYGESRINLPFSVNIIGCYKEYYGEAKGIDNILLNTFSLDSGKVRLASNTMAQSLWINNYEYLGQRFERYWGYPSVGIVLHEYAEPPETNLSLMPIEYSTNWIPLTPSGTEKVSTPKFLSGPTIGLPGVSYSYQTGGSISNYDHPVQYFFDWGDGTDSNWLPVGETSSPKFWPKGGEYKIRARARCANDPMVISDWTPELTVKIELITSPSTPVGETKGLPGVTYIYMTGGATSNIGDPVEYQFDWGDGSFSGWLSGTSASKSWTVGGEYNVKARARCGIHTSIISEWSSVLKVNIEKISKPSKPSGLDKGVPNTPYKYTVSGASSNIGDPIQYFIDWGDGTNTGWLPVGVTEATKIWYYGGKYEVKAKARCSIHTYIVSEWSEILEVNIEGIYPPSKPSGELSPNVGAQYTYTVGGASSNLGHTPLEYQFDWGDGTTSNWITESGGIASTDKIWKMAGNFTIRARARCKEHPQAVSSWSEGLQVSPH